jgi:aspartate/methionine/tyrosine aminotransferase
MMNYGADHCRHALPVYTSKAIAAQAKADPTIANLAIGEPEFGPPEHLRTSMEANDLTFSSLIHAVKCYETSRGMAGLRHAIADWYRSRYGLIVDPETELLITHGGVEAITLAILCTSDPGDSIFLTDPTYMLYARSLQALGRKPLWVTRTPEEEYRGLLAGKQTTGQAKALIINSPENPTGYILDNEDWSAVAALAELKNLWIIHDEVYDTMAFTRSHIPVRNIGALHKRGILVNSFSKKFGVPGLRIGWLCASPEVITRAATLHDYLVLGVNIFCEQVALRFLQDPQADAWLKMQTSLLKARAQTVQNLLTEELGYSWPRRPHGGMFAFPSVELWHNGNFSPPQSMHIGDAVAEHLIRNHKVAVVPGSIYGAQGNSCIRLVLCSSDSTFQAAMERLGQAGRAGMRKLPALAAS